MRHHFAVVAGRRLPAYDTDAQAYITAVENVDGQALETGVRDAINAFFVGCKTDGIWTAIKASCILAGARTRLGALTPLVGTAPTSTNFVDGDYNRETGLIGGTGRSLNTNRTNNADPQDNNHNSLYISASGTTGSLLSTNITDGRNQILKSASPNATYFYNRSSTPFQKGGRTTTGFEGMSRSASSEFIARNQGTNQTFANTSQATSSGNVVLFNATTARLAFYSIGESLDLALLDARVTALINAYAAAI